MNAGDMTPCRKATPLSETRKRALKFIFLLAFLALSSAMNMLADLANAGFVIVASGVALVLIERRIERRFA
jgi:hypothetical protein